MVLDDSGQVRSGELAVGDPARELIMPHAVMSAKQLAVRPGEIRDNVPIGERERSARRLSRVLSVQNRICISISHSVRICASSTDPLHTVAWRNLAELPRVREDGDVCAVGELRVVCRAAEV